MEKIGNKLSKIRNARELTQESISKTLQISIDEYGMIERDEKELSVGLMIKLSEILNVSLDYITKGTVVSGGDRSAEYKIKEEERRYAQLKAEEEYKNSFSKQVYEKWEDLILKLMRQERTFLHSSNGSIYAGALLQLDDVEFISDIIKRHKVYCRPEEKCKEKEFCLSDICDMFDKKHGCTIRHDFNEVYSSRARINTSSLIMMLEKKKLTDKKFLDILCKVDPVKLLNHYYLTDEHFHEKEGMLKCLNSGGYVEKVVEFSQYVDYSLNEDGEYGEVKKFGKDVLATFLLKEYCMKK